MSAMDHSLQIYIALFTIYPLIDLLQGYPCGPGKSCDCFYNKPTAYLTMDCSGTALVLSDTCTLISNQPNITGLDFSNKNLTCVSRLDLKGCENIEMLLLRNTSLTEITNDAFRAIKHLQHLDISDNKLDIYYGNQLNYLRNMTSLVILKLNGNWNKSTAIGYPDIRGAPSLQFLYMDGPPDCVFGDQFLDLRNLTYLSLSGLKGVCNLGELVSSTFENVPFLETLDISSCGITNIFSGTFKGLSKLSWLDVSLNREMELKVLSNISYGLQFTKIERLNLSHAHTTFGIGVAVRKDDICFLRNTSLREFYLEGNRLEYIEANALLVFPPTLKVLQVSDNSFSFGPYVLQVACLENLRQLNIDYQNYAHTPGNYIKEPLPGKRQPSPWAPKCGDIDDYLRNLSLSIPNCRFFESDKITEQDLLSASVPQRLERFSYHSCFSKANIPRFLIRPLNNKIESLDISNNLILTLNGPIGPFPALKYLNISSNYCKIIKRDVFIYMTELEHLNLGNNLLGNHLAQEQSESLFRPLKSLVSLDISSNHIPYLPSKLFGHLENLQVLNLSYNSIHTCTLDIGSLGKLRVIDVKFNALSELPTSLTEHLETAETSFEIDMTNNPIQCSCKQESFLKWMVAHRTSFNNFENYTFIDNPGNPITTSDFLNKVHGFEKSCRSYTVVITVCAVGFLFFTFVVVVALIYKNRWKLRYFMYMNKRRFFGYKEFPGYEPIENYRYDAFISYAEEDFRFIIDKVIPKLEQDGFSLCIHQRDFIGGNAVTDNIVNAIQSSRKTVVLLTRSFLKSRWCLYEFHMARMESIYSRGGNNCLIIAMLERVPLTEDMPLEMVQWLKQRCFVEYSDTPEGELLFWNNLKEAVMH